MPDCSDSASCTTAAAVLVSARRLDRASQPPYPACCATGGGTPDRILLLRGRSGHFWQIPLDTHRLVEFAGFLAGATDALHLRARESRRVLTSNHCSLFRSICWQERFGSRRLSPVDDFLFPH